MTTASSQRALDRLIGIPFVTGGRDGDGLDCYGVTLAVLVICDKPAPDLWPEVERAFTEAEAEAKPLDLTPFVPAGWEELPYRGELRDGDVILIPGHIAAFAGGYVYTSTKGTGAIRQRWEEFEKRYGTTMRQLRWGGAP